MAINRRGEAVGNQLMWTWTMFLLIIAGGGIAIGVSIFYGSGYETRQIESEILSHTISECMINSDLVWSEQDLFYEACGLNEKTLEKNYNQTKLAIRICEDNCNTGEVKFQLGSDFESCDFLGKNRNYPRCFKTSVLAKDGKKYELITSSNHLIRRIYS